jgi:hypothetical protein
MNSPFVIRQAEAASERLMAIEGDDRARIKAAYMRFLSRTPTRAEVDRALEFLAGSTSGGGAKAAWSAFCQALYAGAEFRYLD